jgi:hypothetical protein
LHGELIPMDPAALINLLTTCICCIWLLRLNPVEDEEGEASFVYPVAQHGVRASSSARGKYKQRSRVNCGREVDRLGSQLTSKFQLMIHAGCTCGLHNKERVLWLVAFLSPDCMHKPLYGLLLDWSRLPGDILVWHMPVRQ